MSCILSQPVVKVAGLTPMECIICSCDLKYMIDSAEKCYEAVFGLAVLLKVLVLKIKEQ